ncbi:hypothetical protein HELRODRAFT_151644, partial [Helobdella robusta]|uniref:Death domain-containing protein n=1 Tax=Helobdella robusta TaxID=6412 RepID=T1EKL4_HELRO
ILAFGSRYIYDKMIPGPELPVSRFPIGLKRLLASILDPPSPTGQDWCLLSVILGQSNSIQDIENQNNESLSKTDRILTSWCKSDENATMGTLVDKLIEIGRSDAVDVIMNHAYLFGLSQD